MKRKIFIGCGVILLSLSTIALWNYFSLYRPVTQSLSSDPRNEGVELPQSDGTLTPRNEGF